MSLALATYGFGGGAGFGGGDETAPTIAAVGPLPGVAPGAPGGFSSDFAVASQTPIVVDVTDIFPGISLLIVSDPASGATVFRAGSFLGEFLDFSSSSSIANGVELSILPDGGWPAAASPTDPSYVQLTLDAIDLAGNLATVTLVWELPPRGVALAALPPAAPELDGVGLAVARIPLQFQDDGSASIASPFPAAAAELVAPGPTGGIDISARAIGFAGNDDFVVMNLNAAALGVADLGWVSGVGRVTIVSVTPATTYAEAAAAIVTDSAELTASATGATGDAIAEGIALAPGFPPGWPDSLTFPSLSGAIWMWGRLAGGRDAE